MDANWLALSQVCLSVAVLMFVLRKPAAAPEPRIVTVHRLAPGERALVKVNQRLSAEQHAQLSAWLKVQPALAGVEFVLLDDSFDATVIGATE